MRTLKFIGLVSACMFISLVVMVVLLFLPGILLGGVMVSFGDMVAWVVRSLGF